MTAFSECLASAGRFGRGYAKILLAGIEPGRFARKPRFETSAGVKVVDTNHPAFIFGHLSLYPARLFTLLGADAKSVEAPAAWGDLFKAGAACRDDVDGTIYPAMEAITTRFFSAYEAAVEHVKSVPDDVLARVNPNEQARDRFPTIGVLVNFYLNGHVMMHMGQVSAWRRCVGLPSAM
ncbi:MAG: DinB family protein [Phycisphaerales bacterium]|nr:DinB family protein [Phycisphaerales bacterium]